MNKKGGTSLPMEEYVCLTNMQACLVLTLMKRLGVQGWVGIGTFSVFLGENDMQSSNPKENS